MQSPRCHVAVVGGGPAGLAAAIALAREGRSVHVIERTQYDTPRIGEHLPPSAKTLLQPLGLSELLGTGLHLPCPGIRSKWGSSEIIDKDYLFHPNGEGVNLGRPEFDRSLADVAARLGATVSTASKVLAVSQSSGVWKISYSHHRQQRTLNAEFLVDATGRSASIAKRFGHRPLVYDELVGIVGAVPPVGADRRVYLEASESGWWYSTELANGKLIAAFMTDFDLFDLGAGRLSVWKEALAKAPLTRSRVHPTACVSHLHVRTARTQCLNVMHGDAWLAVGDAAMSYDPLSSEGISKGLEWGRKAARAIGASLRGDKGAVTGYAQEAAATFSAYLRQYHLYYAAEKRWNSSPFWRRRQLRPMLVA